MLAILFDFSHDHFRKVCKFLGSFSKRRRRAESMAWDGERRNDRHIGQDHHSAWASLL
jgi:hypothetical protein